MRRIQSMCGIWVRCRYLDRVRCFDEYQLVDNTRNTIRRRQSHASPLFRGICCSAFYQHLLCISPASLQPPLYASSNPDTRNTTQTSKQASRRTVSLQQRLGSVSALSPGSKLRDQPAAAGIKSLTVDSLLIERNSRYARAKRRFARYFDTRHHPS